MTKSETLHAMAVALIGQNLSPNAPDELGCSDAANQVAFRALGTPIGGGVSTRRMYEDALRPFAFMSRNWRFVELPEHKVRPGDIIISPTGYGNGTMPGHVGIVTANRRVLSNNSLTGKWDDHHTIDTWKERYGRKGGFPVLFYRIIK